MPHVRSDASSTPLSPSVVDDNVEEEEEAAAAEELPPPPVAVAAGDGLVTAGDGLVAAGDGFETADCLEDSLEEVFRRREEPEPAPEPELSPGDGLACTGIGRLLPRVRERVRCV